MITGRVERVPTGIEGFDPPLIEGGVLLSQSHTSSLALLEAGKRHSVSSFWLMVPKGARR